MSRRTALQLMLLCLLIAAALRLSQLTKAPPGLHFDEAANGILAADIGLRDQRPVFISSYTGKETLFFYLAGGLMRAIGDSVFTLRLTSAFAGILTVAATYWLGCEMFGKRRYALIAAALLAVSFWHVLFSRLGFRAISQPLLQALAIAALFRGLRRGSWPWIVASGLALGLTAYTYLAARVFPIPLILAAIPLIIGSRRRQRWGQLGIFAAVGLLVLSPLLLYFYNNPDAFWVRIGQVAPDNTAVSSLMSSYLDSLGMLFLVGDPYWRFNLPGQPLMNWFWGGLLVVGCLYLLIHYRRQQNDWQRSAFLLVLLIPIFMLFPTALAIGEIVPSNLRAIGLAPFIFFLPAVGFVVLLDSISGTIDRIVAGRAPEEGRLLSIRQWVTERSTIMVISVLLVLLIGGLATAQTYFRVWAAREDVFYDSDADLVAVSNYLDQVGTGGDTIFMGALHYRHPTVAFLSEQYEQIKWLPDSQAVVFPSDGSASYVFPHNSPLPEWATGFMPAEPKVEGPAGPDGQPTFSVYRLANPVAPLPTTTINANFDNKLTLLGYDIGSETNGERLPVTLYWRVERPATENYTPYVHLEDEWRYRWGQVETFAYPAEQWEAGDSVVQHVEVPLQPGMPPGAYRLRIGFFDPDSGQQVSRLDDAGRYAGNALNVDNVIIAARPMPENIPEPAFILNQAATPGLSLLGYERGAEHVTAGMPIWVALWWQAREPLAPMTTRLELIGPDNVGRVLGTTNPVHDSYPFDDWTAPQFVIDHQMTRVPASMPPGEYLLTLRLLNAANDTLTTADLGSLTVDAAERLFSPPKSQLPMAATFGEEILLNGYDLTATESGQFDLSLAWQAITEPSTGYTVFIHVLNQDGSCCIWQQDISPQQGAYPTDQWLAGEYVVDKYTIELPADTAPGSYLLEIGLYLQDTGQRLLVSVPGLRDDDALYLRPVQVE